MELVKKAREGEPGGTVERVKAWPVGTAGKDREGLEVGFLVDS